MSEMVQASLLREQWAAWAANTLGGDAQQIIAAANAAVAAVARGGTQQAAVFAAQQAWMTAATAPSSPPASAPAPVAPNPAPATAPMAQTTSRTPRGYLRGRVVAYQQRQEYVGRRYVYVWNFRIDPTENDPAALPIGCEMRGYGFVGSMREGDIVEVKAKPDPGEVLRVRKLKNVSANATVRSLGHPPGSKVRAIGGFIQMIMILVFLAIIAIVAYTILSHARHA